MVQTRLVLMWHQPFSPTVRNKQTSGKAANITISAGFPANEGRCKCVFIFAAPLCAEMSGKDHDTRAHPKRHNKISEQFAAHPIAMLESPAYRALSQAAHMVIARIEIELAHHGGNDNGQLPVTFEHFEEYGIYRNGIAPAIREAEALGFIKVTEHGRGGNAEHRRPNLFYLTFANWRGSRAQPPTHDWRKIKTIEEAQETAAKARKSKDRNVVARARKVSAKRNVVKFFPIPILGGEAAPQNRDRNGKISTPQNSDYCVGTEIDTTSISWVERAERADHFDWNDEWQRYCDSLPCYVIACPGNGGGGVANKHHLQVNEDFRDVAKFQNNSRQRGLFYQSLEC